MQQRSDTGLAFLLQYENIAWYENGKVRILDRRIYPKVEYVTCHTHGEVAKAITDMVTQSAGPFTAGAMGMALAAYECRENSEKEKLLYLERAAEVITNARPTTKDRMRRITSGCLEAAKEAILSGEDVSAAIVARKAGRPVLPIRSVGSERNDRGFKWPADHSAALAEKKKKAAEAEKRRKS